MSGHSKWSTIKRKKGATDQKRGKLFSKLSKVVSVAARAGSNPEMNPSLRMAIDNAKAASMPKENIERAIQKGSSTKNGANYEEVIYEAFLPGGGTALIECLTDNKNRALSEIKTVLNKFGGKIAGAGSVSYQFIKRGEIIIDKNNNSQKSQDEIEEVIIESGAEDFKEENDGYVVTTDNKDLHNVHKNITDTGIRIRSFSLVYNASNLVDLNSQKKSQVKNLIETLSELEDVNSIYTNINM